VLSGHQQVPDTGLLMTGGLPSAAMTRPFKQHFWRNFLCIFGRMIRAFRSFSARKTHLNPSFNLRNHVPAPKDEQAANQMKVVKTTVGNLLLPVPV